MDLILQKFINVAYAQDGFRIVPECVGAECGKEEFFELINNLVDFGITIVIALVAVAIIFGGFMVLTSAGDPGKITQGKKAITAAIVGTVIVFSSWLIVNTLITIFTDCSGQWNVFGTFKCG